MKVIIKRAHDSLDDFGTNILQKYVHKIMRWVLSKKTNDLAIFNKNLKKKKYDSWIDFLINMRKISKEYKKMVLKIS